MSRYIDAEQIPWIKTVYSEGAVFEMAYKPQVNEIPTADVELIRHAYWVKHDQYVRDSDGEPIMKIGEVYECSLCGRLEEKEEPYCNCGAKMDGKVNE